MLVILLQVEGSVPEMLVPKMFSVISIDILDHSGWRDPTMLVPQIVSALSLDILDHSRGRVPLSIGLGHS